MRMKVYPNAYLLLAALLLLPGLSRADDDPDLSPFIRVGLSDELPTAFGHLDIVSNHNEEDLRFSLALNGKTVATLDPEYYAVDMTAAYPDLKAPRYVLLETDSGGSGCPLFYILVEIKDASTVVLNRFGNCNLLDGIQRIPNGFRFLVRDAHSEGDDSWEFTNGKMTSGPVGIKRSPPPK